MTKQTGPTRDDLVFSTSRWQKVLYDMERENTKGLLDMEREGRGKASRFADYQREVFARLYNPRTPKLDEPAEDSDWAQRLHEMTEEVKEFGALQERCKGDEMWAGMATANLTKSIAAKMDKRESNEDLDKLQQRVDALQDMAEQGIKVGKRLKQAEAQLERARDEAEQMAQGLNPSEIRNAIRKACEQAQDDINDAEQQLDAFSYGDEAGQSHSAQAMVEKRALANRIGRSAKLKQIAKMAGRMRRVAVQKQRSKTNYAREEVSSIEQGADVDRLLPSEAALLAAGGELEALFYARLSERKCMQYSLSGRETEGRGPIVICMDESGSMNGQPEVFSKSVAMALLEVAKRQKRSWCFIHFDSRVSRVDVVVKGEVNPGELVSCMEHFTGGGTSFQEPLDKAIELIEHEGGMKKADILLVTDGYCHTSPQWTEAFKAKLKGLDASLYSVLVGGASAGVVGELSNEVFQLHELLKSSDGFEDTMFSI